MSIVTKQLVNRSSEADAKNTSSKPPLRYPPSSLTARVMSAHGAYLD